MNNDTAPANTLDTASQDADNVIVYSKKGCVQCDMTKRLLEQQKTPHVVRMIDESAEALAEIRAMGYSSVPVVAARGQRWAGFQPAKVRELALAA